MNHKSPPAPRILMTVILQVLKEGPAWSHEDLSLTVAARCEPTELWSEQNPLDPARRPWVRAFEQSLNQLRQLGLVYQANPRAYRCTDLGHQVAAKNPAEISRAWLRRGFPDFTHWEYRQEHGNFPSASAPRAPLVIQRAGRSALKIVFNFIVGLMLSLQAFESLQDVEVFAGF